MKKLRADWRLKSFGAEFFCLPVSYKKNLKIKNIQNFILSIVLYGCETWSLEGKQWTLCNRYKSDSKTLLLLTNGRVQIWAQNFWNRNKPKSRAPSQTNCRGQIWAPKIPHLLPTLGNPLTAVTSTILTHIYQHVHIPHIGYWPGDGISLRAKNLAFAEYRLLMY